ncbi:leucine-rich repeat-containing protein 74B [Patella vulgata]|uniref:leucine-rich repeat-containing protein 74B n=1 Tax=Patella vulgata TaxID=6465 RepID=UPI00217FE05B|nr:leucine-rich repeat-containing protein 74B [Patella vulgata]
MGDTSRPVYNHVQRSSTPNLGVGGDKPTRKLSIREAKLLQKQGTHPIKPAAFRRTSIDKSKTICRVKNKEDSLPKNWRKINATVNMSSAFKSGKRVSMGSLLSSRTNYDSDDDDESNRFVPAPNNVEHTRMIYKSACKKYDIVPSSTFLKSVEAGTANLSYQGLESLGTRAVAMALVSNLTITELSLRGNYIGANGLQCIVDMLRDNCAMKNLDISENDLTKGGAILIAKILKENETLTHLKISGNKFKEGDAQCIADALKTNTTLKSLDMSYNEFGEKGGIIIGQGLAGNDALTIVNLRWNHLRQDGIVGVVNGLKENGSIRELDLSWNGLGDIGARALGQVLKENTTLQILNLASCRIGLDGVGFLMTEMIGNDTLKHINLEKNPLTSHGACAFLQVLKNNPSFGIETLDISDIRITSEFLELLTEVKENRPNFEAKHGGTLRGKDAFIHRTGNPITLEDPFDVLLNYVKSNGLRLMDLFQQFDKDKSCGISKDEFILGIQKANLPLNLLHIESLIDRLDEDKNGVVDFSELLCGRQNHLQKKRQQILGGSNTDLTGSTSSRSTSPKSTNKWATVIKYSSLLGDPDSLVFSKADSRPEDENIDNNAAISIPVP